jgi:hypothetical protein
MASSRLDAAVEFLISLVSSANVQTAGDAIEALASYRHSERVIERVGKAVSARGEKKLRERFRQEFDISR